MTRPLHLRLTFPTCWDEVTRPQAIIIGRYFWNWPLTDEQLGGLLMELNMAAANRAGRRAWRLAFKRPRYRAELEQHIVLALEQANFFRWVNEDLCYREPRLGYMEGFHVHLGGRVRMFEFGGPSAGLRSLTYAQFFDAADDLANAYLQSRHPKHLAAFCASLYLPAGEPFRDDESAEARVDDILRFVPQAEQHAALYDFLAMRRWLFTRPEFESLAEFPEPSAEGQEPTAAAQPTPPPFSDVVYSLAGRDVTKVEAVKQQPLYTVLESIVAEQRLAEQAREKQAAR